MIRIRGLSVWDKGLKMLKRAPLAVSAAVPSALLQSRLRATVRLLRGGVQGVGLGCFRV